MAVINIKNVSKIFEVAGHRHIRALRDINLTIQKGESIAIVGESGSGKTTLGRCIVGLQTPSEGSITLGDEVIEDMRLNNSSELWSRVQFIFQDPTGALNPLHRIDQIIGEGLRLRGVASEIIRERTLDICSKLSIAPALLALTPSALTIGEQQRVGVARALVMDPEVIVFDEPTSMLDPFSRYEILQTLEKMRQSGNLAIVLITHDLRAVKFLCDRIVVMYLGEVVEIGSPAKLFTTPSHPFTEALVASMVDLEDGAALRPFRLRGEIPSALDKLAGCSFNSRCEFASPICGQKHPALEVVGEGAFSRCWHNDRVRAEAPQHEPA
jgi:peptide/nickel transport system ATP-binding protein